MLIEWIAFFLLSPVAWSVLHCALSESKTSKTWSYGLQGLEANVRDFKSHVETVEMSPSSEGFRPLGHQRNKSTNSIELERPVQNTSATTCQTSTSTRTVVATTKHRSNNTSHRRDQRSVNDQSQNTDDAAGEASDMNSFMEINDDDLSRQFDLNPQSMEGSGPSMSLRINTFQ